MFFPRHKFQVCNSETLHNWKIYAYKISLFKSSQQEWNNHNRVCSQSFHLQFLLYFKNYSTSNQPTPLLYTTIFFLELVKKALLYLILKCLFCKNPWHICLHMGLLSSRQLVATAIPFCNETMNGWTKWWCFWGNAHWSTNI